MSESRTMWWGYLHQNGKVQVKRWFGDHKDYTDDCEGNEFVVRVVRPFAADSHEAAEQNIINELKNERTQNHIWNANPGRAGQ